MISSTTLLMTFGVIDLVLFTIILVLYVLDKLWGRVGQSKKIYGFIRTRMPEYQKYLDDLEAKK